MKVEIWWKFRQSVHLLQWSCTHTVCTQCLLEEQTKSRGGARLVSHGIFAISITLEFSRIVNEITRKPRQVNHGISITWQGFKPRTYKQNRTPTVVQGWTDWVEFAYSRCPVFAQVLAECSICLLCSLALYQDLWNTKLAARIIALLTPVLDTAEVYSPAGLFVKKIYIPKNRRLSCA